MDFLLVLAGLLGLFFGGESLVRGSAGIARGLGVPPLLVGLTVVGFGTSTPELLVSVDAALGGAADIAVANVLGSNTANVLLIIGLSSVVWPIRVSGTTLRRDTAVMVLAALMLVPMFALGQVGPGLGAVLVASLLCYLVWVYRQSQNLEVDPDDVTAEPMQRCILWIFLGVIGLALGARLLVDGATAIARDLQVSEAFIGLTVVALGTSLPELATSMIAALRRQSEIALGNVVGSNIFNIFGVLGVTALITPVPVAERFFRVDLPVMLGASLLLAVLLLTRPLITRRMGGAMLLAYVAYLGLAQQTG